MKHLYPFALAIAGCAPQPAPQPIVIQQQPPQVAPKTPEVQPQAAPPVAPIAPSASYQTGYNDGYYGTWLSPIRWTLGEEYRNGWSAGNWDKRYGKPNKYPK